MFCNIKKSCIPVFLQFLKSSFRHHSSFKMPPPDRWEKYTPLGSVIDGTSLFAFKVPLKPELCTRMQESEKFTPQHLMSMIAENGQKLGMVVDLTYTKKYYSGSIFQENSIKYVKIMTAGHDIPNDDVYCTFADCLSDFFADAEHSGSLVGVHCTHGVNRTGYLLCRYMIEKLNIQPDVAITAFGVARGHPLERVNYLNDLKMRIAGNATPYPEKYVKNENKYSDVKKNAVPASKNHPIKHPVSRSIHMNCHDRGNSIDYSKWRNHRNSIDYPNWRDHRNSIDHSNWRNHRNSIDDPNWHGHYNSTYCSENNFTPDYQHFRGMIKHPEHPYRTNYAHSLNGTYGNRFQSYNDEFTQRYNGRYWHPYMKNSKRNRVVNGDSDSSVSYDHGVNWTHSAEQQTDTGTSLYKSTSQGGVVDCDREAVVYYDRGFNMSYSDVASGAAGYSGSHNQGSYGWEQQRSWGAQAYYGNKVYHRT